MIKSLLLVSTPFQAMCAYEAISQYKLIDYTVVFLLGKDSEQNKGVIALLSKFGIVCESIPMPSSYIKILFQLLKKSENNYNQIFIGDFFSYGLRLYSAFKIKKRGEIVFLDDGFSTRRVFYYRYPLLHIHIKKIICFIIPNLIISFKRVTKSFFTFFHIENPFCTITHNSFSRIKLLNNNEESSSINKNGVYILGTNYSCFFTLKEYILFISKIIVYCNKTFDNINIYYCPHRKEKNKEIIKEYCNRHNVHYHNTEICVEYDFLKNKINPIAILGFVSTALISLRYLYNDTFVTSFIYPQKIINDRYKRYKTIYNYLESNGVDLSNILKE